MVRLFRSIAVVGVIAAFSLMAIGLMIGTMDVSVQASDSELDTISTSSEMTHVAAKQTLLVQNTEQPQPVLSEDEATALLQEQAELEKCATELENRIKQIETKICLMELNQTGEKKRLAGLLKNLQDRIQARQASQQTATATATVQKEVCTTCVPTQPRPVTQTSPQTAWTQRSTPYVERSSQPNEWRNSNGYRSSNGRRVYFYSSRR